MLLDAELLCDRSCRFYGVIPIAGDALIHGDGYKLYIPFRQDPAQAKEQSGAVLTTANGHRDALAVLDHLVFLHRLCHSSLKILDEMVLAEVQSGVALGDNSSLTANGADHARTRKKNLFEYAIE